MLECNPYVNCVAALFRYMRDASHCSWIQRDLVRINKRILVDSAEYVASRDMIPEL